MLYFTEMHAVCLNRSQNTMFMANGLQALIWMHNFNSDSEIYERKKSTRSQPKGYAMKAELQHVDDTQRTSQKNLKAFCPACSAFFFINLLSSLTEFLTWTVFDSEELKHIQSPGTPCLNSYSSAQTVQQNINDDAQEVKRKNYFQKGTKYANSHDHRSMQIQLHLLIAKRIKRRERGKIQPRRRRSSKIHSKCSPSCKSCQMASNFRKYVSK